MTVVRKFEKKLTLGGIGMLTYSFLLMLLLCWGTGIWAVATELQLSLSDTWQLSCLRIKNGRNAAKERLQRMH